jgi:hypothetical protein
MNTNIDNAAMEVIIEIINELPLPQRVCVFYYYHDKKTIEEIAKQLAVPEDVVKTRLEFSEKKMEEELRKREEEEESKLPKGLPLAILLVPALKYGFDSGLLTVNAAAANSAGAGTAGSTITVPQNAGMGVESGVQAGTRAAKTSSNTGKIIGGLVAGAFIIAGLIIAIIIVTGRVVDNVVDNVVERIPNVVDNIPTDVLDIVDDVRSLLPDEPDIVDIERAGEGDVIRIDDYNWRVLEIQGDRMLIMTDTIVAHEYFHDDETADVTWAESDVRGFLNGEFYDELSSNFKEMMLLTTVHTPDNPWFGASGGADSEDYLFLLSVDEVVRYFGDSGRLSAGGSPEEILLGIDDEFNEARASHYTYAPMNMPWLLRTPPRDDNILDVALGKMATGVDSDGKLQVAGYPRSLTIGIRPAVWIER